MRRRTTYIDDGGEGGEGGGAGGGGETSWRDNLDAGIKDHPALAPIADVPALAQSFLETKEMVGRKGIILPKEGDDGDLARFRTEIGVPENVDGYDLGDFKPPEGLPWDDGFQKSMLGKLHALGIPNGQIQQLFSDYAEVQAEQYGALQETTKKGHEAGILKLKEELGVDYEGSKSVAMSAFKAAAGEDSDALMHIALADGTHLGDHPAFVRTFMNVGRQYDEHGLLGEKDGSSRLTMTKEQALEEIGKIEKHPALYDEDDPEHKLIVAKKDELYERAYPTKEPEVL